MVTLVRSGTAMSRMRASSGGNGRERSETLTVRAEESPNLMALTTSEAAVSAMLSTPKVARDMLVDGTHIGEVVSIASFVKLITAPSSALCVRVEQRLTVALSRAMACREAASCAASRRARSCDARRVASVSSIRSRRSRSASSSSWQCATIAMAEASSSSTWLSAGTPSRRAPPLSSLSLMGVVECAAAAVSSLTGGAGGLVLAYFRCSSCIKSLGALMERASSPSSAACSSPARWSCACSHASSAACSEAAAAAAASAAFLAALSSCSARTNLSQLQPCCWESQREAASVRRRRAARERSCGPSSSSACLAWRTAAWRRS
mmetsp:Transcript_9868/g.30211  ORF Transcript_9868/g.30211 Transcript_9868/m.30211 type:complete len:322 (-) Transcript_9868:119-1084(-)